MIRDKERRLWKLLHLQGKITTQWRALLFRLFYFWTTAVYVKKDCWRLIEFISYFSSNTTHISQFQMKCMNNEWEKRGSKLTIC